MSKQVEAVFDFLCPYCYRGIMQFIDILPEYPDVEVVWRPCESHPRPEISSQYSDLATAAFFYLRDAGGDLPAFIGKVYEAWFEDRKRIDDVELLSDIAAECGGDKEEALQALNSGKYADEVEQANIYAWEKLALEAVPSYISGDKRALSVGGVLVPIEEVRELMQ